MKSEVDNYRGYEIRFDTDGETFECDIDDSRSVKKSYSAVKKFIDDYIKDNAEFKPFKVEPNPKGYGGKFAMITGVRKDGRFVGEDSEGKKFQVSDYEMDKFILIHPDNKPLRSAIADIQNKIEALRKEEKEIESKFVVKTLKDIWPNYKPV